VEAVLRPESLRIFPVNSEIFLRFPAGNDRKSLENIQKLPAGIRSFPEAGIIDLGK
jgi:hypothetical protein